MATARYGYKLADGTKVPSVTTILKIKDPGALLNWAYKTGRAHGVLEGAGKEAPAGLYDGNDALPIGTCVHEMCEVFVKGKDPLAHLEATMEKVKTLDPAALRAQVVSAYSAFEFWCKGTQLEIIDCEVPVLARRTATVVRSTSSVSSTASWCWATSRLRVASTLST